MSYHARAALLAALAIHTACDDPMQPRPAHESAWMPAAAIIVSGVTDLGGLGDAFDISDQGYVAGTSYDPLVNQHAFFWSPSTGIVTLEASTYYGLGVNNIGQVVGVRSVENQPQAFVWSAADGLTTLGTLGGHFSWAEDINDLGQVVGKTTTTSETYYHAFRWTSQTGMVDLGGLAPETGGVANAINNLGQVAGFSWTADLKMRPVMWESEGQITDLGTLGGTRSAAWDLNNLGHVVGESSLITGETRAFFWTPEAGMIDLGTLGGNYALAYGINDLGQVVGTSVGPDGVGRAFIWTASDGMVTLSSQRSEAYAINNRGQVAGAMIDAAGDYRPVVWQLQLVPPAPAARIAKLKEEVEKLIAAGVLNYGQGNALLAKLNAATERLNANNNAAASNLLRAFINQVQAYANAGILSATDARRLIDEAMAVITQLDSGE